MAGLGQLDRWQVVTELTAAECDTVYAWLSEEAYWAKERPREVFDRAVQNSLCFGLKDDTGRLCGFARVVSDRATFAWLCDVFVAESVRGRGGGKALVDAVIAHPDLAGLRRWSLATQDAHGLYKPFGFTTLADPGRFMERLATSI